MKISKFVPTIQSTGKARKDGIRAIVLNAPNQSFDDDDATYFPPSTLTIPRRCLFRLNKHQLVILCSLPVATKHDLLTATGNLEINGGGKIPISKGTANKFYFMDINYMYSASAVTLDSTRYPTANKFLEAVGSGAVWQQPDGMTPTQFGSLAQMKEVVRQATKQRWIELLNKIDSSMKWFVFALLGAIVLAILLNVGGD